MLKQMRKGAHGIFAKLLIIALIASFAVWGIGDMVTGTPSNAVATVGEVTITAQRYDRSLERVRRSFGSNYNADLFQQLGVPDQVLNALINNALLAQEAEKVGLSFSDETLAERIRKNPDFSNNSGEFDRQLFSLVLRDNRLSEQSYLQILREELSIGLLEGVFSNLPLYNDPLLEMLYYAKHETRNADILIVSDAGGDLGTPSEDALKALYTQQRNRFATPEYRTISYVELDLQSKAQSIDVSDAELKAEYEGNIANYTSAEMRSVVQWLFANKEDADKAITERGDDMAASPATASVENGTYSDLGTMKEVNVFEQARDIVFSAKEGSLTKPVKTGFGWHVFMVRDINAAQEEPFDQVKASIKTTLTEKKRRTALSDITIELEDLVAGGASLDSIAKEFSGTIDTLPSMTQFGEPQNAGDKLANDKQRYIIDTFFNQEEGVLSDLTLGEDNRYYIARIDDVVASDFQPFEEVKAELEKSWQNTAQRTAAQAKAAEYYQAVSSGEKTLSSLKGRGAKLVKTRKMLRADNNITLTNGKKLETSNAFLQALFNSEQGMAITPFPLPNGEYAIAIVNEITKAKALPEGESAAKLAVHREVAQQYKNEVMDAYLRSLREQYNVTVNDALYREVANR